MPIKDPQKAREYKRLWIANKRKQQQNVEPILKVEPRNVEPLKSVEPNVEPVKVVEPNPKVEPKERNVEPQLVEPVEPNMKNVEPQESILPPCSRCPEIENSISNFANLYQQEQNQVKEQKRINYQLEKKVKEWEIKVISLQETNQILRKDLGYWQDKQLEKELPSNLLALPNKDNELQANKETIKKLQTKIKELERPINPTIELWKKRYFELEKKYHEEGNQHSETIKRLKDKLRERSNQIENPSNFPKQPTPQANSQIIPLFYNQEHKKFILYNCSDSCWIGKYCNNCQVFSSS